MTAAFCIALPVLPGKKEVFKEFGKTAPAPGGGSLRHRSGGDGLVDVLFGMGRGYKPRLELGWRVGN